MSVSHQIRDQVPVLVGCYFLAVGAGILFGISGGDSTSTAIFRGLLVGSGGFLVIAIIYLTLVIGSGRLLRVFQGLFLVFVAGGFAASYLTGESVTTAISRGFWTGSIAFLRVAIVITLLLVVYWLGREYLLSAT